MKTISGIELSNVGANLFARRTYTLAPACE